jgi:hypothetical protein
VAQHLREWLRLTTYIDAKGLPLPSSVHASDVQEYIAQRPGGRSAPRLRLSGLGTDAEHAFVNEKTN